MRKIVVNLAGPTCSTCLVKLEADLLQVKGVEQAIVYHGLKKALVKYDEKLVDEKMLRRALRREDVS